MFVVHPEAYDPLHQLLWQIIREEKRNVTGGSQKDQARREGIQRGKADGLCSGIAAIVNERRCQYFRKLQLVDIVTETDVLTQVIRPTLEFYRETFAALSLEQVKIGEDRVIQFYDDKIGPLIHPAALLEAELERHRAAVLAGEEDATESDREWINEELKKAKAVFDGLRKIVGSDDEQED